MIARLVVGFLGGLLLGIAAAGLCMLAFGSDSGYWALLLVWIAGIGTAQVAPDVTRACRWLLIASGLAILLLVFASAVVSDRLLPVDATLRAPDRHNDLQILLLGMLLGGLALFAGLWIARDPRPNRHPQLEAAERDADFESTAATGKLPILSPNLARRLRITLVAAAMLLAVGAIVWSSRRPPPAPDPLVSNTVPPSAAPPAAAEAAVIAAADAAATAPPATPAVPAVPAAAPPLTASEVRQECMAQVEAARLFLELARGSPSRGEFEVQVREESSRLRRERPVGPRTLSLIASAMWERRQRADPEPELWSREFLRCEQVRSSGKYYVVRATEP